MTTFFSFGAWDICWSFSGIYKLWSIGQFPHILWCHNSKLQSETVIEDIPDCVTQSLSYSRTEPRAWLVAGAKCQSFFVEIEPATRQPFYQKMSLKSLPQIVLHVGLHILYLIFSVSLLFLPRPPGPEQVLLKWSVACWSLKSQVQLAKHVSEKPRFYLSSICWNIPTTQV